MKTKLTLNKETTMNAIRYAICGFMALSLLVAGCATVHQWMGSGMSN